MQNAESVIKRGCLVYFTCSVLGITKKISGVDMDVDEAINRDYLNTSKTKISKRHLEPITKIRNSAKSYLYSKSLPFPIPGVVFVPKDSVQEVENRLTEYSNEFGREVDHFIANYETYKLQAVDNLKSLYNPLDYPSDIGNHFSFQWKYIDFSVPGRSQLVSPEIYARAQQRFQETIEDFKDTAITALRTEFAKMVNHMVERLSGEKKVFRDTLVGNIKEFIEEFKTLNICDDIELQNVIQKCKRIVDGADLESIRTDDQLRSDIANSMSEIQGELNTMMVKRPVRRFCIAG